MAGYWKYMDFVGLDNLQDSQDHNASPQPSSETSTTVVAALFATILTAVETTVKGTQSNSANVAFKFVSQIAFYITAVILEDYFLE